MIITVFKAIFSVIMVCTLSVVSHKYPKLSGFVASLPITSLLIVVFSHIQYGDEFDFLKFYKGILLGLPVVALFYSPFLFIKNFYLSLLAAFVVLTVIVIFCKYFNLI